MSRTKIDKVTLDALRTRQSLVKGERLVRHEMRAVLNVADEGKSLTVATEINSGAPLCHLEFLCHRTMASFCCDLFPEGFATLSSSAMPEATSELGRSKLR